MLDEFPLDIGHKNLPTRYKGHFFTIIRYIKCADVALDVKILQLTQGDVLGNADRHRFRPFFLDIVNLNLVVAAKSDFLTIGAGLRIPDGIGEIGKAHFALFLKSVQVVFTIELVRDEVKVPLAIKSHAKIFAIPVGVLLEFSGTGIEGLYIGVVVSLITFSRDVIETFPGFIEENFTSTGVFCNVMYGVVVVREHAHWRTALYGNFVATHPIVSSRSEINKATIPGPTAHQIVGIVVGQLADFATFQRQQVHISIAKLLGAKGQPFAIG